MATCVNTKSAEFQTLKERSGLSDLLIKAICSSFLDKYGRFPKLDELPGVNSEPYLRNFLNIKENNGIDLKELLDTLQVNSVPEAIIKVNNTFTDLEFNITPINEKGLVTIKQRPNNLPKEKYETVLHDSIIKDTPFFNKIIEKFANLYGINFIPITNYELNQDNWKGIVPDAKLANAFIYNNNIYINVNNCSTTAPLHELMHLLLGSIRSTDPELYFELIKLSESFSNYNSLANYYKNRTRADLDEEIFISEFSKYVVGENSSIPTLPENVLYNIHYQVKRVLDTILMGQDSVSKIPLTSLYTLSLQDLAEIVDSFALNSKYRGAIDLEGAQTHRILANIKEDLLTKGELKEYCS